MIDARIRAQIERNWHSVRDEVHRAAGQCNRDPDSIRLIGVTKYVDSETTRVLAEAGCTELAESRPQVLWQKAESLSIPAVRWHLIGHLQRNKVRRTLRQRPIIHSIDSERLLRAVAEEAESQNQVASILLEVNISGDAAKTGLPPMELARLLECLPTSGVRVLGLMAMAGWGTETADARRQFDQVRDLRDELQQRLGRKLPELSMGMSGDFREAIAEGATMVRIGSRLFEGVSERS